MPDKTARSSESDIAQNSLAKRPKVDSFDNDASGKELMAATSVTSGSLTRSVKRVSDLNAPIMHLTGHEGEVVSCKFSPNGRNLATASFDRLILLWNAFGAAENHHKLAGHTGAVLQVQWSRDGLHIYSSSADKTVAVWDAVNGERVRKFKGHTSFVNACSASRRGPELVASTGDDGLIFLWDPRQKQHAKKFNDPYPLTSIAFSLDGGSIFAGGIENDIKAWDLRTDNVAYVMAGHDDTITGLCLNADGDKLLSNGLDNTVRIWDVKPFTLTPSRLSKTFEGAPHGFEKNLIRPCWSPDSQFIAAGSGDRSVVVWDVGSSDIVYKLPGHKGCVNDVDWTGSIIVSGSNDKTAFMGELNTSEVK
ncbi:hypothetical protein BATDEDRAFT_86201 [Batrachochytrium dendrobatidis JAM81]|uniref:Uncharacterized protein n=2 Tax=Batrachochytrium dendrobatidis TaxID=109871 RepID=F4NW10_BATDJ|nr:uncharacterized protein BATDEDRAFT_86201 [Batrachochytrium dendrobatidis JAM81]EGF82397.1 hypothetical protein BATDEDRAFT_86201 [Batrachochytrium dendrobatidis JAM81]KAJ8328228.1 hypothetical protein O5D80_003592 [Batrachochytrium dendrobatidis]KAK5673290.1 hypothetical protein QVD99_000743 [Batrachochytrium dendrobatidis]OAJ39732.1 hypothetical protein BDEG_23560 [Batrachochytrium dendrobatidis JEL423]|eukprot:XP_006676910.1 hypothetical protein BATDEDRAFT_86201 [Batrachochytrium dendrobatidis JAM81]